MAHRTLVFSAYIMEARDQWRVGDVAFLRLKKVEFLRTIGGRISGWTFKFDAGIPYAR